MKKFLLIFCYLVVMTTQSYGQWTLVPSGTAFDLEDVHFPTDSVGYIVGDYGITLRTEDRGDSWEITHSDSLLNFQSVWFLDENKGYAAGRNLYKTIDGGITWEQLIADSLEQMSEVYFVNDTLGFASGTLLYRTTDGGLNWKSVNLHNLFSSIYFPSDSVGYFIGGPDFANPLYKTIDGGQSFIPITNGFQSIKESVHFINEDVGFMCGWYAGVVARTTNGGFDWELLDALGGSQCWGIYFANENVGYYIDNSGGNNFIRKTINGGADWTTQILEAEGGLYGFYFFDQDNAITVGYNGMIFKTTNGGGITGLSKIIPDEAVSLYPNPVADEVFIELTDHWSGLLIEIYSLLNHKMISFYFSESITSIDLADLPTGIYFSVISNEGGYRTVKKLIKQ